MDENPHADWIESLEQPIWGSLDEVYERAGLSLEERAALHEYSNITEYYLLRAKRPMVTGLQGTSFVRRLGGYLRFFNSDAVRGFGDNHPPRRSFMREKFGDPKVHKIIQRSVTRKLDSGETDHGIKTRSKAWSQTIWSKMAELQVLALFCANGYEVMLPPGSAEGKKPEFFVQMEKATLGVEVKNLDDDAVYDRIYGDFDYEADFMRDHGPDDEDLYVAPEDYDGIIGMVERQYRNAVRKFTHDPGLIFMFFPRCGYEVERRLDQWVATLCASWEQGSDSTVAGLVLGSAGHVEFLRHPQHQELVAQLRLEHVGLEHVSDVYEQCSTLDLWPR